MHGTIAAAAKPAVVKHRTITLTNRAPIRIVEDDWPILAQGMVSETTIWEGEEYGFVIQVVLRRHKDPKRSLSDVSEILHARYGYDHPLYSSDGAHDKCQTVRVGRILTHNAYMMDGRMECQSIDDLWRHIMEIGTELRERINIAEHRRQVTNALDKLFAALDPHGLP